MCWISMEIGRQIITVDEAEDGIRRRNAWNTPTGQQLLWTKLDLFEYEFA